MNKSKQETFVDLVQHVGIILACCLFVFSMNSRCSSAMKSDKTEKSAVKKDSIIAVRDSIIAKNVFQKTR